MEGTTPTQVRRAREIQEEESQVEGKSGQNVQGSNVSLEALLRQLTSVLLTVSDQRGKSEASLCLREAYGSVVCPRCWVL